MNNSTKENHTQARNHLDKWQQDITNNFYTADSLLDHTVDFSLPNNSILKSKLTKLGQQYAQDIEPLVAENDYRLNLPKLDDYDGVGNLTNNINHHPNYTVIGDSIYATGMMKNIAEPGKLTESLLLFYMSSHLGEAGHNCPVACTAGVIRVLNKVPDFQEKKQIIDKLTTTSFEENFTGAQFITEVQGGSDVALNSCKATQDSAGNWFITGEKWFCSNANADSILMTARFDESNTGTKGLGLFLVQRNLENNLPNHITIRRLKEKLGTRAMASAEIDFKQAHAICMGKPEGGFKLLMQNVLHLSRIYNSFATLGAAQRAYQIARNYAKHRIAFSQAIENYPLIQETLANIRAENSAMLASALTTTRLQDEVDCMQPPNNETLLILRMRANINKYFTARRSVEHIHNCIDVLAGNGAIESFSSLPRLLRDAIVYENWEGTHNTLRMQILRDMHKFDIDVLYLYDLISKLEILKDSSIKKVDNWRAVLLNDLQRQLELSKAIKQSPAPQQTLMVRDFIDNIALLDCCIQLLIEGVNQIKTKDNPLKLKLLEWLLLRNHMLDEKKYSKHWLMTMKAVIELD